jgi:hypothetical protein
MNSFYDVSDLDIYQSFIYPDDRLYTNADEKMVENGLTWLKWDLTGVNEEDVNMEIFKLAPRTYSWYILALIISIISLIVISIYVRKKRKTEIQVIITRRDVEQDGK